MTNLIELTKKFGPYILVLLACVGMLQSNINIWAMGTFGTTGLAIWFIFMYHNEQKKTSQYKEFLAASENHRRMQTRLIININPETCRIILGQLATAIHVSFIALEKTRSECGADPARSESNHLQSLGNKVFLAKAEFTDVYEVATEWCSSIVREETYKYFLPENWEEISKIPADE